MGCIRPATPGFLATLVATGLLAAVSFGVPWIRSIYFLKATVNGFDGSLTLGTLGYCLDNAGKVSCSKPSVGYELDINTLLGNDTSIKVPNVVVKWITYCLVLHIVAFGLAAGSAVFGLLAHVREMSMTCCSTCISGFAAAVAMIAFIFDLALFFLTKARINSAGGSASIGNAIWLTVIAWVFLFFSGIFFCCGRCCLDSRPSRKGKRSGTGDFEPGHNQYVDQVRMDAIKAEADRQAKQKYGKEGGLPSFPESEPLTRKESVDFAYEEGNQVVKQPSQIQSPQQGYHDLTSSNQQPQTYAGGYMPGNPGGRAVDDYYNPTRQGTIRSQASNYSQSSYSSPTPAPAHPTPQPSSQYLAVGGTQYGHQHGGTSSYHSAISHQQGASYDPRSTDPFAASNNPPIPVPSHSPPIHQQQPNPYTDTYHSGGNQYMTDPHSGYPQHDSYPNPYTQGAGQDLERAYTLGGSGYGSNGLLDSQGGSGYNPYESYGNQPPVRATSPTQMYQTQGTTQAPQRPPGMGGAGPLLQKQPTLVDPTQGHGGYQPGSVQGGQYDDSPPMYDEHDPKPTGVWGRKM